ncbi:MAG: DUF481 domain-containing protein, partial [Pirellulaceae bacterium]|nr:DUF481 domain-containing protein [Pirellulaceae bacterium]
MRFPRPGRRSMIGKPHNMFRAFVVVIPLCAAIVCSSFAQDGYGVGQPYPNHNPAAGFLPPYENSTANQSGVQAPGHQSAINRLPPGAPYYPPLPPAVPQYDSRSATPTVTIRQLPNTPPLPHTPGVAELNTSSDAAELAHQAVDGASSWFSPTEWIQPVEWEGSIEVGINAAAGNSESLSMTTGFDLKRTTDLYEMATDLKYAKISNSGVETQHNALYNASIERFYGDTPWTTFGKLFLEYDEFKAFDMRIALNGGIGYKLWETDVSKFVTRFGAGVSHEIDGPD